MVSGYGCRGAENAWLPVLAKTLSHSRAVTAELKLCATRNQSFFRRLSIHIESAVESTPLRASLSMFLHRLRNPAKLLHSACVKRVTRERG